MSGRWSCRPGTVEAPGHQLSALNDEGTTVAELASRLRYRSEAAFARAFKRVVGASPGGVRRQPKAKPATSASPRVHALGSRRREPTERSRTWWLASELELVADEYIEVGDNTVAVPGRAACGGSDLREAVLAEGMEAQAAAR
jgi:hypothetical protein